MPSSRAQRRQGHVPGGKGTVTWTRMIGVDGGDEIEQEVEIEGSVSAYDPGRLSGPPEDCYPADGGEVEIEGIWVLNDDGERGEAIDYDSLSKDEQEQVDELLAGLADQDDF